MTEDRITQRDFDWWLNFAASRKWTFAKTYAETAPHHYIVEGRTSGVTHEDMVRAARVIHTFGQPGKYYSLTKIYLVGPDGRYRWWTEDNHFTDTTLVLTLGLLDWAPSVKLLMLRSTSGIGTEATTPSVLLLVILPAITPAT